MNNIKIGDFLLTKNKQVYRIVDIVNTHFNTTYDLRSVTELVDIMAVEADGSCDYYRQPHEIKCVKLSDLLNFGTVISEKNCKDTLKILYYDNNNKS